MKRESRTVGRSHQPESSQRHLPLVDLLVDTRAALFELAISSGLRVLTTMLEDDRTALCGTRYQHQSERMASRAGTVPSEVVLGGRKVAIRRGVVARIVTGPHDTHRRDPHLPMRYDTGRPRAVIRLRISQPRTTSLPCPAGLRARRPSPMMDL